MEERRPGENIVLCFAFFISLLYSKKINFEREGTIINKCI
jgi:hypothetical protein